MKNTYKEYSANREINPAFVLNQIGKLAYSRAEKSLSPLQSDIITVQLMCALTMEATLNFIGNRIFTKEKKEHIWTLIERCEPREKLNLIIKELDIRIDFSLAPFNNFESFFTFRNMFVHGKTAFYVKDKIKENQIDDDNFPIIDNIVEMQAKWEKNISLKNAKIWRNSVYEISDIISEKAKVYNPVRIGDFITTSGELGSKK